MLKSFHEDILSFLREKLIDKMMNKYFFSALVSETKFFNSLP